MNGTVEKATKKFNNKAEALGFVAAFNTVKQAEQQLLQAQEQLRQVADELGIDCDPTKTYNIDQFTYELTEV